MLCYRTTMTTQTAIIWQGRATETTRRFLSQHKTQKLKHLDCLSCLFPGIAESRCETNYKAWSEVGVRNRRNKDTQSKLKEMFLFQGVCPSCFSNQLLTTQIKEFILQEDKFRQKTTAELQASSKQMQLSTQLVLYFREQGFESPIIPHSPGPSWTMDHGPCSERFHNSEFPLKSKNLHENKKLISSIQSLYQWKLELTSRFC